MRKTAGLAGAVLVLALITPALPSAFSITPTPTPSAVRSLQRLHRRFSNLGIADRKSTRLNSSH